MEDESENARHSISRDESMDRSPTPERLKRAPPKRARVVNISESTSSKDGGNSKGNKAHGSSEDDDVDVGVLLGRSL